MTDIGPLNPKGTPALPIDDNFIRSLQGYGTENIDPGQGVGLPRLTVLQALSPQVKKGDKQIRGAEPGDFCLIGSDHMDLCKNGVVVAPCFYRTEHVHWAEGQRGDAPVHNYYEDDRILAKCKKVGQNYFLPNGDEVVITATWYPLVTELDDSRPLSDAEWVQAFFPLKRSGWTEHKAWKKQIEGEAPIETARGLWKPNVMFWRAWILKPASRHNRKNQDWESWTAEPGPTLMEADPTGGLMQMAMLYADDRKIEATRYKLSLEDKRPIIEGSIAETRG